MAKTSRILVVLVGLLGCLAAAWTLQSARRGAAVTIDPDDIGGVVTGPEGPEAGVWVIAETTDLPTKYIKVVVTDDLGRYLIPDLPAARYSLWVRGYGLVDSARVQTEPGQSVDLTAVIAPTASAAAEYYPANYWYSLLTIPPREDFPGTGPDGNGIGEGIRSQAQWMAQMKSTQCGTCHQMGGKSTRVIPASLGTFANSVDAWDRWVRSGAVGAGTSGALDRFGRQRALSHFADWTDRIAGGELPPTPPRPFGVERNVVITAWDYGDGRMYLHDGTSTYKPNPTVNANGPFIAAPEVSSDFLYVLDPQTNTASKIAIPAREPNLPFIAPQSVMEPSTSWGTDPVFNGKSYAHSTMWDAKGRIWTVPRIRQPENNPSWCRQGSDHPSAKVFPLEHAARQAAFYDLSAKKWTLIDTCFSTHNVHFGEGAYANTAFFNTTRPNEGPVLGWIDTKVFDDTQDERRSQGWTPFILDTNGNGRRDSYVEPAAPVDPSKDKRIDVAFYDFIQNPVDGSVWGTYWGAFPGAIVRVALGSNPPESALTEIYEAPFGDASLSAQGYEPRGLDVDRNGVIWTNLSGSGHLASFDRSKCKAPLNGPKATGRHCPEGWTLHQLPGPHFKGISESGNADSQYTMWVDQFDTFGLGRNVPMVAGSNSDSIQAFMPDTGQFVVIRVPYPMGFYTKGIDGRLDDQAAGWKGKGMWSTPGHRAPWLAEGGKGVPPKVYKFQLRPNPLAK